MIQSLAERLKKAFRPEVHTQAELARAAKVKQPSVSDWFSGETKTLKAEPLVRAAIYLNVNPLWLATGEGPMQPTGQVYQVVVAEPTAPYSPPARHTPAWPLPSISPEDYWHHLPDSLKAQINNYAATVMETARTLAEPDVENERQRAG